MEELDLLTNGSNAECNPGGIRRGGRNDNVLGLNGDLVTCGADGCFFMNAKASGHVPALVGVKAIDTTGAGDIFGGSAVYRLLETGKAPETLEEKELAEIAAFACAAAGLSTQKHGGISSVPDYDDVVRHMAAQ